jgi:hypothetical protein
MANSRKAVCCQFGNPGSHKLLGVPSSSSGKKKVGVIRSGLEKDEGKSPQESHESAQENEQGVS